MKETARLVITITFVRGMQGAGDASPTSDLVSTLGSQMGNPDDEAGCAFDHLRRLLWEQAYHQADVHIARLPTRFLRKEWGQDCDRVQDLRDLIERGDIAGAKSCAGAGRDRR